jgi:hypothetical protein
MRKMNNQLNIIPNRTINYNGLDDGFLHSTFEDSLGTLAGKKVIFRTDFTKEAIALQSLSGDSMNLAANELREFSQNPSERIIASIDSSCVLVGETQEGAIYAGRVATVLASKGQIQSYYRMGPVILYVDPYTIKSIFGSHFDRKISSAILFDRSIAERFVRIYLERHAQIRAAKSLSGAIILADGSLRPSLLEQKEISLRALQIACSENFNDLIGFSKASSLRFISNVIGAFQANEKSQVYLDLTDSINSILLPHGDNKITIARFASNSPGFRVDFSSSNFEEEAQLFADLRFNDRFFRGYPETLRLAHHLSIFDSSTISSVRSYLAKKYDLVQIPADDLRASILGKLV